MVDEPGAAPMLVEVDHDPFTPSAYGGQPYTGGWERTVEGYPYQQAGSQPTFPEVGPTTDYAAPQTDVSGQQQNIPGNIPGNTRSPPPGDTSGGPGPQAPAQAPLTLSTRRSPYDPYIDAHANRVGIDPNWMRRIMAIESGGDAGNATGSYRGLFQLSYDEFKRNGGQGNIYDPQANTAAAANKLAREASEFRALYGREPTLTDIYMVHQQGAGGYDAHMSNPDAPAWQNMYSTAEGRQKGPGWAKQAIWGNLPASAKAQFGSVDNVSSRDFVNIWRGRVENGSFDVASGGRQPQLVPVDYDPWEASAARTRARYPTREPSAEALAASSGAVGFGTLLSHRFEDAITTPQRALQSAGELQRLGDVYNPEPVLSASRMAMTGGMPFARPGTVGAFGGRMSQTEPRGFSLEETFDLPPQAPAAPQQKLVPVTYDPYAWTGAAPLKMHTRAPEDFHAAIAEAKAAHPSGASVTLYSPEEYAGMRTHTTADGSAGFALNGDDIVSVFKHPDSPVRNAAESMLSTAVQMGGRRLDAFDTVLPHIYGRAGFRAVARVPFDPQYAPPGWNYQSFDKFNGGKPDVVFMVHDPYRPGYTPGEGIRAGSYDEAVAIQKHEADAIAARKEAGAKKFKEVSSQITGLKGIGQYLTPPELERVTARNAERLVDVFTKLPSGEEMAAVAFSGRAKRGWYRDSANALVDIFGANDSRRFAGLLAALSPQNSVEMNAQNALRTWNEWVKAGRPTDIRAINYAMDTAMGGKSSVLPAWRGNTIRILRASDPATVTLSGPKVNSFMENLRNNVQEVTNDTWMANYANMEQKEVSAARVVDPNAIPGFEPKIGVKSPGYLAFSAATRRAAQALSHKTGEVWTPAEVQETVWSWAKTLYEKVSSGQIDHTAEQLLKAGGLSHEEIANTPDFALLFASGIYRKILEEGGYGAKQAAGGRSAGGRRAPSGSPLSAEGSGFTQGAFEGHLGGAARRLDERRAQAPE